MNLTDKEAAVLKGLRKGMDAPGEGWLCHMRTGGIHGKALSGVIGSLVKKGLITTEVVKEAGYPDEVWVRVIG